MAVYIIELWPLDFLKSTQNGTKSSLRATMVEPFRSRLHTPSHRRFWTTSKMIFRSATAKRAQALSTESSDSDLRRESGLSQTGSSSEQIRLRFCSVTRFWTESDLKIFYIVKWAFTWWNELLQREMHFYMLKFHYVTCTFTWWNFTMWHALSHDESCAYISGNFHFVHRKMNYFTLWQE